MPPSPLSLTLIVAATPSLGIGRAGALPWPMLRSEMAYFARVTKRANRGSDGDSSGGVNAVIMGRRTWESIPLAFRPLRGRLNVVVSRSVDGVHDDEKASPAGDQNTRLLRASSLESALKMLEESKNLRKVFVIGGAEIYRSALQLPNADRVLLTRIKTEFECDVHFPLKLGEVPGWQQASKMALDGFTGESVPEGIQAEKGVEWEFEMWEKDDPQSGKKESES